MSRFANPGELRTPVIFKKVSRTVNANGFPAETEAPVLGGSVYCKWVNAHGTEVWEHQSLQVRDRATLTLRYDAALDDETLLVYREGSGVPFEIVSCDNVQNRGEWLEVTVQRKVTAR